MAEVTLEDNNQEFLATLGQDTTFASLSEQADQEACATAQFPRWNQERMDAHRRPFPLNDSLLSLLFLAQSDLNETQRERLVGLSIDPSRIPTCDLLVHGSTTDHV